MTKKILSPIVYETPYNKKNATQLDEHIKDSVQEDLQEYLINYPTVYIINEDSQHQKAKYTVYVGETNDIQRRTLQHLDTDPVSRKDWQQLKETNDATMFVIGHKHFNKSLTLDIENRMMHYLSGVNTVSHLNNRRDNAQKDYFTADEMETIFNKIWHQLHQRKPDLFPMQRIVEESALFKASPFFKLSVEQLHAKNQILDIVGQALKNDTTNQLVLVEGEAGAGKTVLMSNIFYDLAKQNHNQLSVTMMVNHPQQEKIYRQIVDKLDIPNAKVQKVVTFINKHTPDKPIDIAFVDEAHLLLTKRSQAYYGHGNNELLDIIKRAKVTVAVYDDHQILSNTQIIEDDDKKEILKYKPFIVPLHNQMRIHASKAMVKWLRNVIDNHVIEDAPHDKSYDLRVFDDPATMQAAISKKATEDNNHGISRMLATFDWPYSGAQKNKNDQHGLWEVSEGDWHMPWNLQLRPDKNAKHQISGVKYSDLSWAEQPHTVREIGSTYTVQGSDLNYAGVVLGPSIKYRNGRIVFDASQSKDKKVYQHRLMHDGSKKEFSQKLIQNEFNVLMTRGVNGLYIYAVDPTLRKALKQKIRH